MHVVLQALHTEAKFYVDQADSSGIRHLVVIYAAGGYGGKPEFASGIPNLWTDDDIIDLILRDRAETKFPIWEMEFGSPMLDRSRPVASD
jgi:hypothetical protein